MELHAKTFLSFPFIFAILQKLKKKEVFLERKAYLHSPFSSLTISDSNRFILLQFILSELFSSYSLCLNFKDTPCLSLQTFNPLYLSTLTQSSPFDRLQEHVTLLPSAFPLKRKEVEMFTDSFSHTTRLLYSLNCRPPPIKLFSSQMKGYLRQMFFLLEPFLEECKNDERFLYFLLSHYKDIRLISRPRYLTSLLKKLHPEGLSFIQEEICNHFYKHGFACLIPEIKSLVKQVKKG